MGKGSLTLSVLSSQVLKDFVAEVNHKISQPTTEMMFLATIKRTPDGGLGAHVDGSSPDQITPVVYSADVHENDRVTVIIKNHTAYVNGNTTNPSSSTTTVANNHIEATNNIQRIYELLQECATSNDVAAVVSALRKEIFDTQQNLVSLIDDKTNMLSLADLPQFGNCIETSSDEGSKSTSISADNYKIIINNKSIKFLYNNEIINEFSSSGTSTNDLRISVGHKFINGNFAEIPRSDGSSMLVKVGA